MQDCTSLCVCVCEYVYVCTCVWVLPATDCEIGDGVEIRAKHFSILEELITKCVQSVQRYQQVGSSHPVLDRQKERRGEKGKEKEREREKKEKSKERQRHCVTSIEQL